MCDTYNLMWKLNLVIKGLADPKILGTYKEERLTLGQQLVDFDRKWAALASGRAPPETPQQIASIEIERNKMSTAAALVFHGLQVVYGPGLLTHSSASVALDAKPFLDQGELPLGVTVGMRMPSHPMRYHASGFLGHLGDTFKSNGRFKVVVFPGDLSQPDLMERFRRLTEQYADLMRTYTPSHQRIDSVIELITVHTEDPLQLPLLDLPDVCHPFDSKLGWDYDKVFYEGHEPPDTLDDRKAPSAYKLYEVDSDKGMMVVVRPDGYAGLKCDLQELEKVKGYFEAFLYPQGPRENGHGNRVNGDNGISC